MIFIFVKNYRQNQGSNKKNGLSNYQIVEYRDYFDKAIFSIPTDGQNQIFPIVYIYRASVLIYKLVAINSQ